MLSPDNSLSLDYHCIHSFLRKLFQLILRKLVKGKQVLNCEISSYINYCIPASCMMIHSHLVVHDVLQLLRHVLVVEKAALVGKVFGKAKQQTYQQQYQLSLTLQFQSHAGNVDASNSLEANKK